MASIEPVTLTITRIPNSANVTINVRYVVAASGHDLASEQNYREVCELIGDDTPGDGTDDVLGDPLFDATTVFSGTSTRFPRVINVERPFRTLDEDNQGPVPQADEIRARVTLTPIPTRRESNQIVVNVPVVVG